MKLLCFLHPSTSSKHYIVQHTQSVSVPILHPSGKESSVVTSFETYIYICIANTRYQAQDRYAIYSCVWRLWLVFLEHGGGVLAIFKSPVCTYNRAWTFSLSASHYFCFLSKRSGRRMPPAERSALHILCIDILYLRGAEQSEVLYLRGGENWRE